MALNWNVANVEWSKFMFPPKSEKIKGKPKRDTNVVEFLWPPLTKV